MKWARRVSAKDSTRSRRQLSLQVEPLEGRALLATSTLNQVLVAEDFQVFLHRSTANDPAGLTFWSTQLNRGVSPNTVGLRIANSTESATDFVTTQYQKFLGRAPDSAGLTFWLGQLTSGRTPDQVKAGTLGSAEFFAKAGSTNQGFLNALYADVLGRPPDTSGNTSWLNALASGVSRTTVHIGRQDEASLLGDILCALDRTVSGCSDECSAWPEEGPKRRSLASSGKMSGKIGPLWCHTKVGDS